MEANIFDDAWKKAEEIKKEKKQKKAKLAKEKQSHSVISASSKKDKNNEDDELQAILDSAWNCSKSNIFKKKRNSVASKASSRTEIGELTTARRKESKLKEIDENDEVYNDFQVDDVD